MKIKRTRMMKMMMRMMKKNKRNLRRNISQRKIRNPNRKRIRAKMIKKIIQFRIRV